MSDNFKFDQFVKEQMGKYTPEVPNQIWDNILAARRKSRPKAFWYSGTLGKVILSTSLIATVLLGGYLIYHNTSNQPSSAPITQIGSEHRSKSTSKTSTSYRATPTQSTSSNVTKEIDPPANQELPVKTGSVNSKTLTGNLPSTNSPLNLDGQPSIGYNAAPSSYISKDVLGSPTSLGTYDTYLNSPRAEQAGGSGSNPVFANKERTSANPFLINQANARELPSSSNISIANTRFVGCPTLEKNAAGNKKYWEIYAGPDYVINNFKTLGDTSSYNYLQKRKASTAFTSAYSAGIRYTRVFENGMSARAGVNYSQTNEKFTYVNLNELRFVTVITKRVVVRSPGDTLYFSDTLQYQQSGVHVKTTYNHYRNIDIPVVIGYEFGNGKIHANINAGVIINVYSWYKGDILDTSYQPVSITTGKTPSNYQYRTNIGVGFLGSFSLYYKLTDKMHLLLEPYFRYNLSPMSKENLNLQQKYHTVGLRTGIRIDLQ